VDSHAFLFQSSCLLRRLLGPWAQCIDSVLISVRFVGTGLWFRQEAHVSCACLHILPNCRWAVPQSTLVRFESAAGCWHGACQAGGRREWLSARSCVQSRCHDSPEQDSTRSIHISQKPCSHLQVLVATLSIASRARDAPNNGASGPGASHVRSGVSVDHSVSGCRDGELPVVASPASDALHEGL